MDLLNLLGVTHSRASEVVDQLDADHLGLPSTCDGWTVQTLIDKMLTSAYLFADFAAGAEPPEHLGFVFPPSLSGSDTEEIRKTFQEAIDRCHTAFERSRLLGQMQGPLGPPIGRKSGVMLRITDCTVNTWDLAKSIGAEHGIDDAQAERVLTFASELLSHLRASNENAAFAEPTPLTGDHGPLDQLIALSGRNPDWARDAQAGDR